MDLTQYTQYHLLNYYYLESSLDKTNPKRIKMYEETLKKPDTKSLFSQIKLTENPTYNNLALSFLMSNSFQNSPKEKKKKLVEIIKSNKVKKNCPDLTKLVNNTLQKMSKYNKGNY